jgi:class 3 adenylate cyclase
MVLFDLPIIVALLFIDITSFSKTIAKFNNDQVKTFLDDYYARIIPLIYKHGGEIEKLMGDGIICLFGRPFLDMDNPFYVYRAEECAEEVIKEFYGTNKNVKVAIHQGTVNYYKVPGEHYGEYTIIGQPITDLYRLESVSKPNAINFYSTSSYDKLGWKYSRFNTSVITLGEFEVNSLQGVDYRNVKYMNFPNYM